MPRYSHLPLAAAIYASVIGLACAASAADPPAMPKMPDSTPPGKPHFDSTGVQVGEQLPDLPLYTLEGEKTSLHAVRSWRDPTLLLTSSYSCPKSRKSYPDAAKLAEKFKDSIQTALIYVIEAHPKGDASPYTGAEDLTTENQRDHVFCSQPRTLEERLVLAKRFQKRLEVSQPIYVDAMDNAVWKSLGGGPNMGFLIDQRGVVLARQGWFDAKSMEAAEEAIRAAMPKPEKKSTQVKEPFDVWETPRAAEIGDLEKVKSQIAATPELVNMVLPYNARGDMGGRALLHYAVESKHLPIVEFLVAEGADVNLQTEHAPTPLHLAAKVGDAAIAKFLIDHGAKVNAKAQRYGPTPLQEALINGNSDVAQLLLKAGAKPNFFTDVASGNSDAVQKRLAEDPTVVMRPDGWDRPPLAYAAGAGQEKIAAALLAAGVHDFAPAAWGKNEFCAIWWAVEHKNARMIRLLCRSGSDPNLLREAIWVGSTEAVRELLAQKADPNREDNRGYRPLHWAAIENKMEIARMLIAAGADPNSPTGVDRGPCGSGSTDWVSPLHFAASDGSAEMVAELLQYHAKADSLDHDAKTPLHYAAMSSAPAATLAAVAKKLIEAGARVNAKDSDGNTPLDLALKTARTADKPDSSLVNFLRAQSAKMGSEVAGPNGVPPEESQKSGIFLERNR